MIRVSIIWTIAFRYAVYARVLAFVFIAVAHFVVAIPASYLIFLHTLYYTHSAWLRSL